MTPQEEARLQYAKDSLFHRPPDEINPTAIIYPSALIGDDGFGFARDYDKTLVKMQHAGNVIIQANVEIRAFTTVDRAVNGSTIIGEGTKIDHHCHIAHGAKIGKWNTLADNTTIEGGCEIGDYNTFGSNVVVQTKVKVGSNCKIGSNSTIVRDVPDNTIVTGLWKGEKKVEVKYTLTK